MASDRTITPDAFTVSPELVGLPLASPRRRALAMLIDLALVGILVKTIASVFLPLLAGALFLRAKPGKNTLGRGSISVALRFGGALMIFIFLLKAVDFVRDTMRGDDNNNRGGSSVVITNGDTTAAMEFGLRDLMALPALAEFTEAENEEDARDGARRLAEWVRSRSGNPAEQARAAQYVITQLRDAPYHDIVVAELAPITGDSASTSTAAAPADDGAPTADPVVAYATAVAAGDSARADSLREVVEETVMTGRVEELEEDNAELEKDNAELREERNQAREELERHETRGIRGILAGLADDLGLGFGWMALYFTVFVFWWKGQTPGKRLLGMRIIRLDARPISWWISFERFGGYAASFSIGLLGFLQILWDRNRQGLHDKAVETVVIRL